MKKKKKSNNGLLIVIFIAGLSLLLYPSVANYINELHGSRAISDYSKSVSNLDHEKYDRLIADAREFNRVRYQSGSTYTLSDEQKQTYEELLNVGGDGIMGYIEIPTISVMLPIYHGTSEAVLQSAVGHLDWTSLPVGGENTHSVLSGHRGLPSAKLFTNLDKLVVGDVFMIRILNEILTYEVDQILIVLPENTSALQIEPGKDLCTLVTCTPYGINSHRMLVRGHRIENAEDASLINITSEAVQVRPTIVTAVLSGPALLVVLVGVLISSGKRKRKGNLRKETLRELNLRELKLREQQLRETSLRDDHYRDR